MPKAYKIGIAQFAPALGDSAANAKRLLGFVARAKKKKLNLLVTPELALNGYLLEELAAESSLNSRSASTKKLATSARGICLVAGAAWEDNTHRISNAALVFEKGKLQGKQEKLYLPSYGMFDEARYFRAGEELKLFDLGPFKAALLLCEDAWHASLAVQAVQRGAQLLVVLAASPARGFQPGEGEPSIRRTWDRVLGAAAETLGCYVVFANRVGLEDGIGFWGGSTVISPEGQTIAHAPLYDEMLLEVELDPGAVRRARRAAPIAAMERRDFNARAFAHIAGWQLAPGKKKKR